MTDPVDAGLVGSMEKPGANVTGTTDANPVVEQLDRAWAACDDARIGVDEERLTAYAEAVVGVARVDLDAVPEDPESAVRQVVLGTLLLDPVLAALRRLAQQHLAVSTMGPVPPGSPSGDDRGELLG